VIEDFKRATTAKDIPEARRIAEYAGGMMSAIPGQFHRPGIAGQQAPDGSNPSGGDTQLEES